MTRLALRRGVLAAAVALSGCLHTASEQCGDGGVCPPGMHCGRIGDVQICVSPPCGDGRVDPGEVCDDDNNVSGDGCPADCSAPCGDHILDPGEACDDGNNTPGDGCSADCRSLEVCGNAILDPGEACDDGGAQDHDGCSRRCSLERPEWTTVDGVPDPGPGTMAYDALHESVVLYSFAGDTWEWDGRGWQRRQPATRPAIAPRQASMVYDAGRRRIVLFGDLHGGDAAWEWDGSDWSRRPSTGATPAVTDYAIAYDVARHRVVLFGGLDTTPQDRTWEWDGARWEEIATPLRPPPRSAHAMTYDRVRGKIVLYGGVGPGAFSYFDTWEYDGSQWSLRSTLGPPRHLHPRLAYDLARHRVVLSSGAGDAVDDTGHSVDLLGTPQTWEWDGTRWDPKRGVADPSPRVSPALAYDVAHDTLVLFGGQLDDRVTSAALNDTWLWDGRTWRRRDTQVVGRRSGGLAYDQAAGALVLFGGQRDIGFANDTWAWDGANWQAYVQTATVPSPRAAFAIAGDGDGVTIFGGTFGDISPLRDPLDETWVLRHGVWTQELYATAPDPRMQAAMAYDAARGVLVLFGGSTSSSSGAFDDTWELDHVSWVKRSPAHVPPARRGHAMAYDPSRQRVVMFGGNGRGGVADDEIWEWTGTDWERRTAPASPRPTARGNLGMAYDAGRGALVVFGGFTSARSNDTWEWDGAAWAQRTPPSSPAAREGHAMAYDPTRRRVVMFGGVTTGSAGDQNVNDVWEWDGVGWRRIEFDAPRVRSRHAMAYDASGAAAVLFGGRDAAGNTLGDTWTWAGAGWRAANPGPAPSPRSGHAMAFDAVRDRTVLFGGADPAGQPLGDTWEWDRAAWIERAPPTSPAARSGHALAYDAARGELVLFGGSALGVSRSDQWLWDGDRWREVTPAVRPSRRSEHAAAFDAARGKVVLFGGRGDSALLGDLWEWDGTAWTERTPGTVFRPAPRAGHTLGYDAMTRRIVLFGGQSETASLADAWAWDGTAWTQLSPATVPSARQHQAMVGNPARRNLLMFGGDAAGAPVLDALWWFQYADPAVRDEACGGLCAACGNGVCEPDEGCRECPADCGPCPSSGVVAPSSRLRCTGSPGLSVKECP